MDRIKNKNELLHSDISEKIIFCCFEVMKELGSGFLENVYKNALFLAMKQKGLNVWRNKPLKSHSEVTR
jgi:GxxExxY protein